MASKTTNEAVRNLRRRQQAEEAALSDALGAAGVVGRARSRRETELARLDVVVGDAEAAEDVALAVLAALLPVEVAAQLAGVGAARVRQAQQRASADVVAERVKQLTGGASEVRRRGGPRRSGRPGADAAVSPGDGGGSRFADVLTGGRAPTAEVG